MLNIILHKQQILLDISGNTPKLPTTNHISKITDKLTLVYASETEFVAILNEDSSLNTANTNNIELVSLRQALSQFDIALATKLAYYKQLANYYITHNFCGTCGNKTRRQKINKFVYCEECKSEIYPHIAPCIIVRIHKNEQILMARGIGFAPNVWGLIAGFVEIGESLEEAVHREVAEEVGIKVKNLKYWGSQPWPFPSTSLMLGFTAEYDSGEIILQAAEIEAANFFTKNTLPGMPSTKISIASQMIEEYIIGA